MEIFLPRFLAVISWFVVLSFVRANACEPRGPVSVIGSDSIPPSAIRCHVFRNPAGQGFGYEVSVHGKMLIHQASIPCVPGNNGFASETEAARVAGLVAEKIGRGIMPPMVTIQEMKSLGIHIPDR
ncbi:MAG TPA: DUF4907 domain-containing protein [Puia sp.]|nr:DUF4907 domain-containing protein [Puia sp.]